MNIFITKEWWMFKVIKLLLIAPIWSLYNVYCIKQIIESSSAAFPEVAVTWVLLGPFHFPSQPRFRKVVPLQMWQMALPLLVSLEVLLVKMMRLPLSFAAVSKRKQADFLSARKQQWAPNLQQHRWAAVTAWAETGVCVCDPPTLGRNNQSGAWQHDSLWLMPASIHTLKPGDGLGVPMSESSQ